MIVDLVPAALAISAAVYAAGLLCFGLGALRPRRPPSASGDEPPSVAVVVAARDEADHVEACLEALCAQTYPASRYEVVLVDDGSRDGTGSLARAAAGRLAEEGPRIRVLDGPSRYGSAGSKKSALGLGISESSTDLILTTDADCRVPRTWVAAMSGAFAEDIGAVVGFSQIGRPGAVSGLLARWEALDFLQLMTAAAGSCALGHPMAATGQNLAFRRSAYDQVGGYASILHRVSGDDVLLLQLIRRARRWRLVFCDDPGGHVVHPPSASLGRFLGQRARWASNAPGLRRLDPVFFTFILGTFGLAVGLTVSPLLWSVGLLTPAGTGALWLAKAVPELGLALVGAALFGRRDLLGIFPLWALLHPAYTAVVGGFGALGFYRWKGRSAAFGRRSPRKDSAATGR